jgi:hypothetical protein
LLIERDFTMDEQLKKIGIITLLVGAALAAQADEKGVNSPLATGSIFSDKGADAEIMQVALEIVQKLDQYSDWDKDGGPEPRKCSPD